MMSSRSNSTPTNILLVGVGGQGVIAAGAVLADAALAANQFVYSSGSYGMAQRGGATNMHLRFSSTDSPMGLRIPHGLGDVMLAFEPAEALRNVSSMKKEATVIINVQPTIPMTAYAGKKVMYPSLDDIRSTLEEGFSNVVLMDALEIAKEAGDARAVNAVMLGALSATGKLPFGPQIVLASMEARLPKSGKEVNRVAFESGQAAIRDKK